MVVTERHCRIFSDAVEAMDSLTATIMLLHGFDGMSDDTIAEIIGVPVERICAIRTDAVKFLLSRCCADDSVLFGTVDEGDLYGLYEAAIAKQYISEKAILETWMKVHKNI